MHYNPDSNFVNLLKPETIMTPHPQHEPKPHRHRVTPRTLIFVRHGEDILFIKGAPTKHLWPNLYNGIGGHVEKNETILQAALRELEEETGINQVELLSLCAIISVEASADSSVLLFVYTAVAPSRHVHPSSEGQLEWLNWEHLAPELMVEDLPLLLPVILQHKPLATPIYGIYRYNQAGELTVTFTGEP